MQLYCFAAIAAITSCNGSPAPPQEPALGYEELSQYAFETFDLSNGMKVNYREEGPKDAPVILLVHGGGDSLNVWNRWVEKLKEKYRVVRLDLPGHGLTDPDPDGQYSSRRWGDFIHQFTEQFGLKKFTLVGHSYGGEASLHYISKYPGKVTALGLVAAGAYAPEWEDIKDYVQSFNRDFAPGKKGTRQSLEIMFADPTRIGDDIVTTMYDLSRYEKNQGAYAVLEEGSGKEYQEVEGAENIAVPTLLLWGDQDKVSSLDNIGRRLNREIPNSKLIIYPGVGHMPNYAIADQSVSDFLAFLDKLKKDD